MTTAATQSLQGLTGRLATDTGSILAKAVTQADSTQSSSPSASSKQLGVGNFLTLFTTQLKNQDPTNPMQSHELAAQLAQFSSVEELTKLNSTMREIENYLISLTNSEMVNLIGKEVSGVNSTIQLTDGKTSNASFDVGSPASVTVRIYNEEGALVRTIASGQQTAGNHAISWDGRNDRGNKLANGNYTFKVEAAGADGKSLAVTPRVRGTVYSLKLENGATQLVLGGPDGIRLPASEVTDITRPAA
jgi:flagellar basal-body rod modification protein FlgD